MTAFGVRPATVWLTGLSGAGKSTIGRALVDALQAEGEPAVLLDGDEVRAHLSKDLGFSAADRDEQVARVGWICELLNREGVTAVAALVSPYRAARERLRSRIPVFVEVHVDAPLDVLEQRDTKGLYRRTRAAEMRGLTGVDDVYEPPEQPDVHCRSDGAETPADCVARILNVLRSRTANTVSTAE